MTAVAEYSAAAMPARADVAPALAGGGVLALITGVEGPHYRNPGAVMGFPALEDGDLGAVGQLSSGCIEADLALHAAEVWRDGAGQQLRYGLGSPFVDLRLPCGGGLDVALITVRDPAPLRAALDLRAHMVEAAEQCGRTALPELAEFGLIRQSRLSVVPVGEVHYAIIAKMAGL